MSCSACETFAVLLWQSSYDFKIVLWDGKNTYWTEEIIGSDGYNHIEMDKITDVTESTFTFIGML